MANLTYFEIFPKGISCHLAQVEALNSDVSYTCIFGHKQDQAGEGNVEIAHSCWEREISPLIALGTLPILLQIPKSPI